MVLNVCYRDLSHSHSPVVSSSCKHVAVDGKQTYLRTKGVTYAKGPECLSERGWWLGSILRYKQIKNLEPPVGRSSRERCGLSVPEGDQGYQMRGRRGRLLVLCQGMRGNAEGEVVLTGGNSSGVA